MDLTSGRPTVADFMDELTEVEKQVSGQSPDPVSPHSTTPESAGRSRQRLTASTATQELDDLMATLSDFKMPPSQTIPVRIFTTSPPHPTPTQNVALVTSPVLISVSPPGRDALLQAQPPEGQEPGYQ